MTPSLRLARRQSIYYKPLVLEPRIQELLIPNENLSISYLWGFMLLFFTCLECGFLVKSLMGVFPTHFCWLHGNCMASADISECLLKVCFLLFLEDLVFFFPSPKRWAKWAFKEPSSQQLEFFQTYWMENSDKKILKRLVRERQQKRKVK